MNLTVIDVFFIMSYSSTFCRSWVSLSIEIIHDLTISIYASGNRDFYSLGCYVQLDPGVRLILNVDVQEALGPPFHFLSRVL